MHVQQCRVNPAGRRTHLGSALGRAGAVAGLFLVAAGCGDRSQEPAHAPIRFAYQDRVADAVSIVAVRQGLFATHGLTVETMRFSSGPACSETLYTGAADVGTMGDTTAVIAVAREAPVRIVASHGGGEHRHRVITAGKSAVSSVSELTGKRVAVKKGTSTYGGWLALLGAHEIDHAEIETVDMRPADMPEALASGSVDAVVASEPTPSLAETMGGRELATLGKLGNQYPILLVMRGEFLRSRTDDAARFLRALAEAADFIQSRPDDAAKVLAEATGLSPEVARRAMGYHTYRLNLDSATLASLAQTADFLKRQGIIDRAPDLDVALDSSLLEQARAPLRDR